MAVLRKEKKGNFTIIDNAVFRDYTLSMKAKGLLCQMLSLPDEWEWSVEGLTKLSTDGKSAITSALDELKRAGYFRREQRFNGNKFDGYEYVVSETKMSDFTFTENPSTENTMTENPPQLNTNTNLNMKYTNPANAKVEAGIFMPDGNTSIATLQLPHIQSADGCRAQSLRDIDHYKARPDPTLS